MKGGHDAGASTLPPSPPEVAASPRSLLRRAVRLVGPGMFFLGYTIGTGSVTTMATSGSEYGMGLVWAVALSCASTFFLVVGVSRSTIVNGQTFIGSIRDRFGRPLALFLIGSLLLSATTSVMGVTGIVAELVAAWTARATGGALEIPPVLTALAIGTFLFLLFRTGSHRVFLNAMAIIASLMSICFVLGMSIVVMGPEAIAHTLPPMVPAGPDGTLILAGMIGTTMAGVVIVARSYVVDEHGWNLDDLRTEGRDAGISLSLTFLVSAAIMASAAGTLYPRGLQIETAIDMVLTLEPIAGRFAALLFVVGIIAAACSSLFPNYVLGPWLVLDYLGRPRDLRTRWARTFVLVVAAAGLVVPLTGTRPIAIMIASQAVSPVVMPLIIITTLILLNRRKDAPDEYRNPRWLNAGLFAALAFSLFASYAATMGLLSFFGNG